MESYLSVRSMRVGTDIKSMYTVPFLLEGFVLENTRWRRYGKGIACS